MRLLGKFPQFTEQYVLYELPMVKGWAYYSQSMESDPVLSFFSIKRVSRGYIGQEVDSLLAMIKDA